MGLIDVVRRAQGRSPLDAQGAGLSGLKPTWLEEASSAVVGNGELVSWRGVPAISELLKLREEQEEQLVAELNAKADDSLSLTVLNDLLRSYFQQVLDPNLTPNPSPNPISEQIPSGNPSPGKKKRVPYTGFCKLLREVSPLLGQKLLSSTLRACLVCKEHDAVRAMLNSHALSGNTYPDLVSTLIEHDQPALLCMWMRNVCNPRFHDLLLGLKYFLKSSLRAGKSLAKVRLEWRQSAVVAIERLAELGEDRESDEESKGSAIDGEHADRLAHSSKNNLKEEAIFRALLLAAAVDHFQPYELCLHCLVAFGHDEAVLASIVSQLDNNEVLKLLRYLKKWLEKYSRQGSLCARQYKRKHLWVPHLRDILQWVSVLLDAHLMSLVLCSDFHDEIRSVQLLIKDLVDVGHKLAPLVGVTEHLQTKGLLPAQTSLHREDAHVIEYLEI